MPRSDLRPVRLLGRVTVMPKARRLLSTFDVNHAMQLQTKEQPARGITPIEGCRFLGAYRSAHNQTFWLITEADQGRTTVLMPDEY